VMALGIGAERDGRGKAKPVPASGAASRG